MKTILYARVSSEQQAINNTIQSQIETLREYARDHDLEIVEEILDDGYSGSILDRPGLDQVRDFAAAGKSEAVLVLSPDRLARKQALQIILLEEFKKANVQIIFTNQQFGDSPEDQLMLQVQGAISEYERAKILDRTRRGQIHSIKKGQVWGAKPPYGYKYIPKNGDQLGHYEIDEQEAQIVRDIYHWYVNDQLAGTAIAKRLMDNGIPSRSRADRWWPSVVYLILKNETYTGTTYMNKTMTAEPPKHPKSKKYRRNRKTSSKPRPKDEWITIDVPQIIDRDLWEAAQRRRKKNVKVSKRNNKRNKYMLRGLVICGECGSMAPGYVSNKTTYYSCGAKRNGNVTTKPHDDKRVMVRHSKLDQLVWDGLTQLLDDPDQLQQQMAAHLEKKYQHADLPNVHIEKLDRELAKLEAQEKRVLDAYREEIISLDELREQKEKIANLRRVAEAQKKASLIQQEGTGQQEISIEMLGDLSARYTRVMANADFQTQEKIANLLINRVVLFEDKAKVEGNIPVNPDALVTADQNPLSNNAMDRGIHPPVPPWAFGPVPTSPSAASQSPRNLTIMKQAYATS